LFKVKQYGSIEVGFLGILKILNFLVKEGKSHQDVTKRSNKTQDPVLYGGAA
jgi:hypothetical protein